MAGNEQKILLADDDESDIELTILTLKRFNLGNTIDVARDGAEVLDYLHRRGTHSRRDGAEPVLILLDLNMPKINGIAVLKEIRNDPRFKNIPVIIISTSRDIHEIEKCYELGVNDFVEKPLDFLKFLKAIRNIGLSWTVSSQPESKM